MLNQDLTNGVLTLTLNRPEKKNALTQELTRELRQALRDAAVDPRVRVVVLTGEGDSFCSGADVANINSLDSGETVDPDAFNHATWDSPAGRADRIVRNLDGPMLLHEMPKPTIARVRGDAVGAGLSHALACDFRYIDSTARFMTGFTRMALPGDLGISYFLQSMVGLTTARELLLLGTPLDAGQIIGLRLASGLESSAVELDMTVTRIAAQLAEGPTLAYRAIKHNLAVAARSSLRESMLIEAENTSRCLYSADFIEAQKAFLERRTPKFVGR